jgi:hypothetical protein
MRGLAAADDYRSSSSAPFCACLISRSPTLLCWYQGRCSPNTRRLVAEEGGFIYNADSYADDLPYWDTSTGQPS